MNIILVSGGLSKTRTFTISTPQLFVAVVGLLLVVLSCASLLQYVMLRHAANTQSPYLQSILSNIRQEENQKSEHYVRDNLNAMAVRLGQMQAQLLRLDVLGQRLAQISGFKSQDLMFDAIPGRGGAPSSLTPQQLTLRDFDEQINGLSRQMDDRSDKMGLLDSLLTLDYAKKQLRPSVPPVSSAWHSSDFGWRLDPFSGLRAFHEGIDFIARVGAPIVAAAGGVVVFAAYHPEYGNMVEIDHGNDLVTRYGHASTLATKVGDVVLRGQKIGEVGNTGRSTGTHLHFEVRYKGAAQNPARFLKIPS